MARITATTKKDSRECFVDGFKRVRSIYSTKTISSSLAKSGVTIPYRVSTFATLGLLGLLQDSSQQYIAVLRCFPCFKLDCSKTPPELLYVGRGFLMQWLSVCCCMSTRTRLLGTCPDFTNSNSVPPRRCELRYRAPPFSRIINLSVVLASVMSARLSALLQGLPVRAPFSTLFQCNALLSWRPSWREVVL